MASEAVLPGVNTTAAVHALNLSDDEAYDYFMYLDYMSSVDAGHIPSSQLVPVVVAYGLTFVLGLLGNALVIFTILKYRRMQSVTNVFLLSLSLADVLVIVVCVPIKVRTTSAHVLMNVLLISSHQWRRCSSVFCRK